ncbi:hypothetical protein PF005_g24940 [Phytophthora fragariae]|uniref:RxLR effector protein n=1 Tax=Phytophthora fragariae TaxID=53985 RepID=A0A6A3WB07_9STRA|nr:hypothetical protein PF003_g37406 [Phytophthora fragariae]KAE8924471.1 hypothetical protein PF009_g25293 [Phytophthora fragariae]KAE8975697.1 hypothetical protein PF011_g24359 [Phytophthora fragariae]KAE9075933.1 hypothetical protein PF010_g24108 [Phytophthora fragariae]KAE9078645.1 hypothetical protein PF007_g23767 [Phytophthora fragariae]
MRFCYFVLATAATLVACINAENQLPQTTSELVARTLADAPTNNAVTRSLCVDKQHGEEDSLDSLNSLDETEERGKINGLALKKFEKLVKAKHQPLRFKIENLSAKNQRWATDRWKTQSLNQKQVATKLGMKSVNDITNRNYKFFEQIKHHFKEVV